MMLVQSPKHPVLVENRMESFLKSVEVHECVHVFLCISGCMSDVCNVLLYRLTMHTFLGNYVYICTEKNTVCNS